MAARSDLEGVEHIEATGQDLFGHEVVGHEWCSALGVYSFDLAFFAYGLPMAVVISSVGGLHLRLRCLHPVLCM